MTKKKKLLNTYERKIIRTLYHTRIPLSQYEVAKISGMSWGSAKKYSNVLKAKKLILAKKKDLIFNYELIKRARKRRII